MSAQLSGMALDLAVAQAEGLQCHLGAHAAFVLFPDAPRFVPFMPSTDWRQGGPIIEAQSINLLSVEARPFESEWGAVIEHGQQEQSTHDIEGHIYFYFCSEVVTGPTPLIAAMRCYVAAKAEERLSKKVNAMVSKQPGALGRHVFKGGAPEGYKSRSDALQAARKHVQEGKA